MGLYVCVNQETVSFRKKMLVSFITIFGTLLFPTGAVHAAAITGAPCVW